MQQQLLQIIPLSKRKTVHKLLTAGKIDGKKMRHDLQSRDAMTRKKARTQLAGLLRIPSTSLRVKKNKTIAHPPPHAQTQVPPPTGAQKKKDGIVIPLLDLFLRFHHQGKQNQMQTLYTLTLLNKEYNKAFQKFLDILRDRIKIVVSLCHFFDLTRRFPKNTFQAQVGFGCVLDDPKIGWKSRAEYRVYIDPDDRRLHVLCHKYDSQNTVSDTTFPNTKKGFEELLDMFVPILKKKVLGIQPYWMYLRPLTPYDRTILKRHGLIQDGFKQIDPLKNTVFKTPKQTLSHWDMSYLNQLP